MNKETKETLNKVAEYTEMEKNRLRKYGKSAAVEEIVTP